MYDFQIHSEFNIYFPQKALNTFQFLTRNKELVMNLLCIITLEQREKIIKIKIFFIKIMLR